MIRSARLSPESVAMTTYNPIDNSTFLEYAGYGIADQSQTVEQAYQMTDGAAFPNGASYGINVALVLDRSDNQTGAAISVMTLHGAKGLEFDVVFLPGWEEGLFPSQRSMDESGLKGLEEERRLAYVGLTRARRLAYICYAANRRMYGNWISAIPSRFVDELPQEHIDSSSETGTYNSGRSPHWDSSGVNPLVRIQPVSYSQQQRPLPKDAYARGVRVYHEKFGKGVVVNVDGQKLDIAFDRGGTKRVMDSFVSREDE